MGVFIKYGETIEGGAVDFIARAWYKNGPVEHPVTKTVMCRYTTDRNSLGTIKKSYPIPTDEEIKAHIARNVAQAKTVARRG